MILQMTYMSKCANRCHCLQLFLRSCLAQHAAQHVIKQYYRHVRSSLLCRANLQRFIANVWPRSGQPAPKGPASQPQPKEAARSSRAVSRQPPAQPTGLANGSDRASRYGLQTHLLHMMLVMPIEPSLRSIIAPRNQRKQVHGPSALPTA